MISTASEEGARGISQIAASVDGLNQLTEELHTLMGRFQVREAAHRMAPRAAATDLTSGDGSRGRMPQLG